MWCSHVGYNPEFSHRSLCASRSGGNEHLCSHPIATVSFLSISSHEPSMRPLDPPQGWLGVLPSLGGLALLSLPRSLFSDPDLFSPRFCRSSMQPPFSLQPRLYFLSSKHPVLRSPFAAISHCQISSTVNSLQKRNPGLTCQGNFPHTITLSMTTS